ncbi:DUF402 domain-containing protein [Halomarina oriensis]|uniref:Probable ribonuclease FAU-1 n=1 Tax=Halomarina oriensis TaxID=671145 RepID=A0A6B0GPR0_9EURY|nr:DUF402 domain-containing protein [Halomarina oriensis]MWG35549.1 DUF402 domain-containing protein [Halomarina oriensis]
MTVRVRGIYTTALTRLLHDDVGVVQASEPIRERFDATFPVEPAGATVRTTDDRQGVGVSGGSEAVASVVRRLESVGVDTLTWPDSTPESAVFDARVAETNRSGAVLDLGETQGWLPFSNVDDEVDAGESLRVQVHEATAPWSDDRPVCTTGLTVEGELARLVRGEGGGTTGGVELASLLPTDPRDGWTIRWDGRADEADLDALTATVERLNERAAVLDALPEATEDAAPARLTDGRATTWVWFGRESRFALDDLRREVTPTMAGHHRAKAATNAASAAVDFAEAVCADADGGGEFPFAALTRQFGPREGDGLALGHGKPSGRLILLGRGEVTEYDPVGRLTLERGMTPGGTYDALGVERRAGDVAVTKLQEGRWWYPTVYRGSDGERRGTYVNVCTPVELFPDVARYVDLHVDVVKHADGRVERVDDDELDEAVAAGEVPEPLAEKARAVASAVESALR